MYLERTRDQTYLVYVKKSEKLFGSTSIKVFSPFYNWPVYHLYAPATAQDQGDYWLAFCLVGREGIKGIYPLN